MSLEEKIAIYQFGQGVQSAKAILDHFRQLDEPIQRSRLYDLYVLVLESNPIDYDIDQAIADSSLTPSDTPCVTLKAQGLKQSILFMPDGDNEDVFELLLYVFKLAYQRQYTLNKENAADWWYMDLSRPETTQELLARHHALVEEIYANPSFRSEFVCLAKLWFEYRVLPQIKVEEPVSGIKTPFDFLTYDEMTTKAAVMFEEALVRGKKTDAMGGLQNSVSKGLAVRYKLADEQAMLVVVDVIQRHMQELYNLGKRPYF